MCMHMGRGVVCEPMHLWSEAPSKVILGQRAALAAKTHPCTECLQDSGQLCQSWRGVACYDGTARVQARLNRMLCHVQGIPSSCPESAHLCASSPAANEASYPVEDLFHRFGVDLVRPCSQSPCTIISARMLHMVVMAVVNAYAEDSHTAACPALPWSSEACCRLSTVMSMTMSISTQPST